MNYEQRIKRVMDFIGKHLDEELTLDQLSRVACFSSYHFHRLFTAHTGVSLHHYIRWLRLKRAAHQLIVDRDSTILEIALNAGFESHESFSRAFKQVCGVNPKDFRVAQSWSAWEKPPYDMPETGEIGMNVTIKEIDERRLAVVEHRGDPKKIGESVNKLISWAKTVPLKPAPGEAFGFAYDDPKTTPADDFRLDLALTVPKDLNLKGAVIEKYLPQGRYAVALHKGSRDNISETVYSLYRDWLPQSQEELGDLPCIFCYYNFDHEVAETELVTECWLLLQPK
jgi:AraC family transcriptional regulator